MTVPLIWVLPLFLGLVVAAIGIWQWRRAVRLRRQLGQTLAESERKFAAYTDYRVSVSQVVAALQKTNSFEALAQVFMTHASTAIGAHYGVFYVFDEDSGGLIQVGGYGLMTDSQQRQTLALGEGMLGQCARDLCPVKLITLPDTPIRIKSGTGNAAPKQLLMQALVQNGHLAGLIEFATITEFTPIATAYLEELMPTLAMSIEILDRSLNTQALLTAKREQAEQLVEQQAALKASFVERDEANKTLQSQIKDLADARRAMLNIMEDLEQSRTEVGGRL